MQKMKYFEQSILWAFLFIIVNNVKVKGQDLTIGFQTGINNSQYYIRPGSFDL